MRAIDNLDEFDGYKVVGYVAGDGGHTMSQQITAMKPYFDALTNDEKRSSILMYGSSIAMRCSHLSRGDFLSIYNDMGNNRMQIRTIEMSTASMLITSINTSGTVTCSDQSSSSGSNNLTLYVKM